MTISRAKSGKYYLTKKDRINGFYIHIDFEGIKLLVPLKSLFDTNKKLDGIPSLSFSTAKNCPSKKLGLCQLKDNNLCYALRGEKQASKTYSSKGYLMLNSFNKTVMDEYLINMLKKNSKLLNKFILYIDSNFKVVRFNKKGDFKNKSDYLLLCAISLNCKNTVFYGYTARDDLLNNFFLTDEQSNLFINGSNKKYTNRFKTTSNLQEYINSTYKCLGDCKKCKKCYNLKNKQIICLLHGSNIGAYFNNQDNREFLITVLNQHFKGLKLTHDLLTINLDLLTSLNKAFKDYSKKTNIKIEFANYKELAQYLEAII